MGVCGQFIPLLHEELEILVHVLFEVANALGGESMRNCLPLAGVLCSVSGIEESSLNRHEGVVELSVSISSVLNLNYTTRCRAPNLRFQEPIAMPVDLYDCRLVRNTDMIWLDPDQLSILRMGIIDTQISLSLPSLQQQPQIRELCCEWSRDIPQFCIRCEIWYQPKEHEGYWNGVGSEDEVGDRHFGGGVLAVTSGFRFGCRG